MPISDDEWNKGKIKSGLKDTMLSFLESRRSQAFTDIEILETCKQSDQDFSSDSDSLLLVRQKLEELIKENKVKSKLIEIENSSPKMYYKYN